MVYLIYFIQKHYNLNCVRYKILIYVTFFFALSLKSGAVVRVIANVGLTQ